MRGGTGDIGDAGLFGHGAPLAGLIDPGRGDFVSIQRAAEAYATRAQTHREMTAHIQAASERFDANTSATTNVLSGNSALLRERLLIAVSTFEACRNALVGYATAIESIRSTCDVLAARARSQLEAIHSCARIIDRTLQRDAFGEWVFRWDRVPDPPSVSSVGGATPYAVSPSQSVPPGTLFDVGLDESDVSTINRARVAWLDGVSELGIIRTLWEGQIEERTRADDAVMRGLDELPLFDAAGIDRTGVVGSRLNRDHADILNAWGMLDGHAFESAFGDDSDTALDALSRMPTDQVAGVWAGLSPAFRRRLADRDPHRIGALHGVDPRDRDYANVKRLGPLYDDALARYQELAAQDGPRSYDGNPGMAAAAARLQALRLLRDRFGDGRRLSNDAPEYLLSLDASGPGQPLVAISVGDLTHADNVAYLVPGMNSSALELPDYARAAARLRNRDDKSAVILWLNYVSPNPAEVAVDGRAQDGARRLQADIAAQSSVSAAAGLAPRTTAIGHSYGSTVLSLALADEPLGVDSVVLVGSAGVPGGIRAPDLHVPTDQVFASQAEADSLASTGRKVSNRADPEDVRWGAQVFGVDGVILPGGNELEPVESHDAVGSTETGDNRKYFGERTESLYNIRRIMRGESVTVGVRNDPHFRSEYAR